jgi:hypothetical protein
LAEDVALRAENADLKSDLATNAGLLARQTDLAREAETQAMELRAEVERLTKAGNDLCAALGFVILRLHDVANWLDGQAPDVSRAYDELRWLERNWRSNYYTGYEDVRKDNADLRAKLEKAREALKKYKRKNRRGKMSQGRFDKHFYPLTADGETVFTCAVERSLKLSKCEAEIAALKADLMDVFGLLDSVYNLCGKELYDRDPFLSQRLLDACVDSGYNDWKEAQGRSGGER